MNSNAYVSVVIPCYNGASFLRETLESVLAQTHTAHEVIVIDDGSTDNSGEIAASFGRPVRVIRQENQGESVARNRGMDEAEGNWIALLDADDIWEPNKLERQIEALREAPQEVACVYSDYLLFGSVRREVRSRPMWPIESERRVRMLTDPWIFPSSMLFPTELGRSIRFPSDIIHGEDKMFPMLLFDRGPFVHIPEPLVHYRKHPSQQTALGRHGYRVVESVWTWAQKHPELLNDMETNLLRSRLTELLISYHDRAFWNNDWEIVEQARAFFAHLAPDATKSPPLFERDPPNWPLRTARAAWNSLLDILPVKARVGLWRACRHTLERIKRGRAEISTPLRP